MTNRASQPDAWFEKAAHDLTAVEHLAASPALWDVVAFHAQQAAEKYLKGYPLSRGDAVPRIHDLATLLTRCCAHDETLAALEESCERLSRIGWLARYPDTPEEPTADEVREAVGIAREIKRAIVERTDPPNNDDTSTR
jgi:HEPN domain-containing protein